MLFFSPGSGPSLPLLLLAFYKLWMRLGAAATHPPSRPRFLCSAARSPGLHCILPLSYGPRGPGPTSVQLTRCTQLGCQVCFHSLPALCQPLSLMRKSARRPQGQCGEPWQLRGDAQGGNSECPAASWGLGTTLGLGSSLRQCLVTNTDHVESRDINTCPLTGYRGGVKGKVLENSSGA